ncbi:MAG: GntR family transcriptional regulator [Candidatus Aminicenantaceae bacterium]
MAEKSLLNLKSLKDQVYEYLREQMQKGEIRPGSFINMEKTSQKLGVSKTPLRDALLQLEMETFVSILPRRGVVVNYLTLQDIRDYYEIIGALESAALLFAFDKIKKEDIKKLQNLNIGMEEVIKRDNFTFYYMKNLKFHNVFLDLCKNSNLVRIVNTLKKRLYDFPRQQGFVKKWEEASIKEHKELVDLIEQGRREEAASFLRGVHWSYEVQEKFIKEYYKHASTISEKVEP